MLQLVIYLMFNNLILKFIVFECRCKHVLKCHTMFFSYCELRIFQFVTFTYFLVKMKILIFNA